MTGNGISLSTLDDVEAFAALPAAEWDALVEALPHPSPYVLHGWLAARLRHRVGISSPRIHVARRDGRLVGALPLEVSTRFGLRLGDLAAGPHAVCADLLLAPGEPEETGRSLVERAASSDHDFLRVHGLAADSRLARLAPLTLVPRVDAPVLDLSPGWPSVYRDKVSKRHRQDHRHKRRALAELGALETRVARSPAELAHAVESSFLLHELRWEGRDDRYGYTTDASRAFVRDAVALLGSRGQYGIVTVELDTAPIAFLSYFLVAGAAVGHRTAFDPRLGRFSPGVLVFLDAFERFCEEGIDRFEFGGGDEPFKRTLSDRRDRLCDGFGLATDVRGAIGMAAALEVTRVRSRVREWEPLRRAYPRVHAATAQARASRDARRRRSSGRTARAARERRRHSGRRPG